MTDTSSLAVVIVRRRDELGMTQAELAEKAGVAHRTVQNVEYGKKPIAAVVAALARALEMDEDALRLLAEAS